MPLAVQGKLLRFLENQKFMRVGGSEKISVDVRIVSATLRPLAEEVEAGRFRADLYYRIQGVQLDVPPLRARGADLIPLIRELTAQLAARHGVEPVRLSRSAVAIFESYHWPGNIRELRNAINRAVLLASGGTILPEHLQSEVFTPRTGRGSGRHADRTGSNSVPVVVPPSTADAAERQRILDALAACGGNQTRAAKLLGIARRTLTSKLDKLGIPRPRKDREQDEAP